MRWTEEQESLLVENADKGAKKCRDLIALKCGVSRSVEATRRHGNRLGLTLIEITRCPHCGRAAKLNKRSGLCMTCNVKELRQRQQAINSVLIQQKRMIDGGAESEYIEARKEYDALRQTNGRLRRKSRA